jgi:hypothetical protein
MAAGLKTGVTARLMLACISAGMVPTRRALGY